MFLLPNVWSKIYVFVNKMVKNEHKYFKKSIVYFVLFGKINSKKNGSPTGCSPGGDISYNKL